MLRGAKLWRFDDDNVDDVKSGSRQEGAQDRGEDVLEKSRLSRVDGLVTAGDMLVRSVRVSELVSDTGLRAHLPLFGSQPISCSAPSTRPAAEPVSKSDGWK